MCAACSRDLKWFSQKPVSSKLLIPFPMALVTQCTSPDLTCCKKTKNKRLPSASKFMPKVSYRLSGLAEDKKNDGGRNRRAEQCGLISLIYCTGSWMSLYLFPQTLLPLSFSSFSLFVHLLPNSSPFVIIFPPILFLVLSLFNALSLPVSVFSCHLPLLSLPLWKVFSKSTLTTKAVWWH